MTVLTLAGKPINWAKPPKPTDKVMWSGRTTWGRLVIGSLRTIAHLDRLDSLARKKFGVGVSVMQAPYHTGYKPSAGTHDLDACIDAKIVGVPWDIQERFFRANGAGAYHRTPAQGFVDHIHYFVLPEREGHDVSDDYRSGGFKVGVYVDGGWSSQGRRVASSQIEDYYEHRDALASHAPDHGWFPPNIEATIFDLPAYIKRRQAEQGSTATRSKHSATIRVATNNIMSLPENTDYRRTLLATPGASVLLVQEADTAKGKAAIKALPGYTTHVLPDDDTYNAFVLYKPLVWTHVSTRFVKQYSGVRKISKTRRIAVTVLHHKVLGCQVAFVPYHAVTAGEDAQRMQMRKDGLAALRHIINSFRKRGIAVIVGGDYNTRRDVHPSSNIHTAHKIDHQYVWNGKRVKMARNDWRAVATASDHDALVVSYTVTTK